MRRVDFRRQGNRLLQIALKSTDPATRSALIIQAREMLDVAQDVDDAGPAFRKARKRLRPHPKPDRTLEALLTACGVSFMR